MFTSDNGRINGRTESVDSVVMSEESIEEMFEREELHFAVQQNDLDRVKEQATRVLEEYAATADVAETAAQKEEAEAGLRDGLSDIVEEFEEVHGPSEDVEAPSTTKDTVDVVLRATGFQWAASRVYEGTAASVAEPAQGFDEDDIPF